jgi:thiamine-phosphate pyrophosphorylase
VSKDKTNRASIARLVDANLNRASEAIRVLEDITRFVNPNGVLSASLKKIRHRLREIVVSFIPERECILAREPESDVGKDSHAEELKRLDITEVLTANFRRAQEATRVLEEVAKLFQEGASESLKKIRYELYGIHKRTTE